MNRATFSTLAAAVLTACAHDVSPSSAPDAGKEQQVAARDDAARAPSAALADGHVTREEFEGADRDLRESLDRLAALEIIDVGALVSEAPDGAQNCYGPCEDDPAAQAWMQEHVDKIERLHALVDTAEKLSVTTKTTATWAEAQEAVQALDALKLVEIKGIHHESPSCYVGNCPGDPQRAAVLVALAKSVRGK